MLFEVLIATLIVAMIVGYMIVNREDLLFYPKDDQLAPLTDYSKLYREEWINSGDQQLYARHYTGFSEERCILYFHGNYGNVSYYQHVPLVAGHLGVNVFMVDYRGFGNSTGHSTINSIYEDGIATYDYLIQKYDPKKIIIWGDSLGTTVSTYVAAKKSCEKLLLVGAFASLRDVMLGRSIIDVIATPLIWSMGWFNIDLPTKSWIDKVDEEVLYIHSKEDSIVPFRSNTRLLNMTRTAFRIIAEGGHLEFDLSEKQVSIVAKYINSRVSKTRIYDLTRAIESYREKNPLL